MFNHTQNENGTYSTRCLYCFMTIASTVESEATLETLEARHICPEMALAEILEQERIQAGELPPREQGKDRLN